ncbi:hypothetical protein AMTRI_Chr11g93560 [Amborella trichopoda]
MVARMSCADTKSNKSLIKLSLSFSLVNPSSEFTTPNNTVLTPSIEGKPNTTKRILLGSFATPEMAATAYDVAAIAIKGKNAALNFPISAVHLPAPASRSPSDIMAAASLAAKAVHRERPDGGGVRCRKKAGLVDWAGEANRKLAGKDGVVTVSGGPKVVGDGADASLRKVAGNDEVAEVSSGWKMEGAAKEEEDWLKLEEGRGFRVRDEELLFVMPNLAVDMGEGVMLSPPRTIAMVEEGEEEEEEEEEGSSGGGDDSLWSLKM